jgi:hypothetical protein
MNANIRATMNVSLPNTVLPGQGSVADVAAYTHFTRPDIGILRSGQGKRPIRRHGGRPHGENWDIDGISYGRLGPYDASMIQQTKRRPPPLPVVLAAITVIVGYALPIGSGLSAGGAHLVAGLITVALVLGLGYGLLRGSSVVLWLVSLILAVNVMTGVPGYAKADAWWILHMLTPFLIAGLLWVPTSARQWFGRRPRASAPDSGPSVEIR